VVAAIAQNVPALGGVLNSIFSGQVTQGRFDRVKDQICFLNEEVEQIKDKIHAAYVKTEEFEELVAQTLEKMSREIDPQKRSQYRRMVVNLMVLPPEDYNEQRRLLRLAEELTPKHIQLLRAFHDNCSPQPDAPPETNAACLLGAAVNVIPGKAADLAGDLLREKLILGPADLWRKLKPSEAADLRKQVSGSGIRLLDLLAT